MTPVRLSALAAADIAKARDWHDSQEPGLGDKFLARVNEAVTRIAQNPFQYAIIAADLRRANLTTFRYGVWYSVEADGSVVVACLHHRQPLEIAKARTLKPEP